MKFRSAYERDPHKGISFPEKVAAQQQYKDECDVNTIIERYTRTGVIPSDLVNNAEGVYGDFSDVGDYTAMQNAILKAKESFDLLPSNIRDRFNHDPGQLIKFVSDDNNYDEAVKLGIVSPKSAPLERENVDNVNTDN